MTWINQNYFHIDCIRRGGLLSRVYMPIRNDWWMLTKTCLSNATYSLACPLRYGDLSPFIDRRLDSNQKISIAAIHSADFNSFIGIDELKAIDDFWFFELFSRIFKYFPGFLRFSKGFSGFFDHFSGSLGFLGIFGAFQGSKRIVGFSTNSLTFDDFFGKWGHIWLNQVKWFSTSSTFQIAKEVSKWKVTKVGSSWRLSAFFLFFKKKQTDTFNGVMSYSPIRINKKITK